MKHVEKTNKFGDPIGTACGAKVSNPKETFATAKTVTCPKCKKYLKATGDGPESLKSLFSF